MIKSFAQIKFQLELLQSFLREPKVDIEPLDVKAIFVVSTGRTGTHFLSHFFNENFEDVYAVHEPKPDFFKLDINFLRKKVSEKRAIAMFRSFRNKKINYVRSKQFTYIESNSKVSFLIPVIRKLFRTYKIVHVIRDGRDVVRSKYSRKTSGKYVKDAYLFSDKDPKNRLNARDFPNDPLSGRWSEADRFTRNCWHWMKKDSLIHEEVKNDPNAITVKFEDLFVKKDLDTWFRMIDFVGLKDKMINQDILQYIEARRSNEMKSFELPKYEEWSWEQKEIFHRVAADYLVECDYDYQEPS